MNKPLPLSAAYVTWVLNQDDNMWIVRDKNEKELGRFPQGWSEKDCMIALRLGRKYEIDALNAGIEIGNKDSLQFFEKRKEELMNQISALEQMNIILSEKLEKFIIGEQ